MKQKLVRDNIPQIIFKNTKKNPTIKILDNKRYKVELKKKLKEEVSEYLDSEKIEELADIEEVILALVKLTKTKRSNFEKIRSKKAKTNGRFNKKILLIEN